MDYHIFKKSIKKDNKVVNYWYYWYKDPETEKQVQKACKGCKSKYEAVQFIENLPKLRKDSARIMDIGQEMYLPNSMHINRREQLGRSVKPNTMAENRRFIDHVISAFGGVDIRDLTIAKVGSFLFEQKRSSSWKNQFIGVLSEVYAEANWLGISVIKPVFVRFHGTSKKSDIFTSSEISRIFDLKNFANDIDFILLLVTLGAGLRISEARALQTRQFMPEKQMIIIDGFMDRDSNVRNAYNKTGSGENPRWRVAILAKEAAVLLSAFIQKYEKTENDYLFLYCEKPYRIEYARSVFKRVLKIADIEINDRKLTLHSLRYTYVTRMRAVMTGDTVKKMVGHSSAEMTDYYTRAELAESAQALLDFVPAADKFFNF